MKNYGIIPGEQRKSTDFVAGALPYIVVLENGDWAEFAPPGEWQRSARADSMSCVSFSAINVIETLEFEKTGKRINYSDRWIAKMSETTNQGNYLHKVLDTIRKYGLVLEEDYPAPPGDYTFEQYHSEIPEPLLSQLKAKGQEWLKTHLVQYEWTGTDLVEIKKALKQAPLQVIIPGHAVEEVKNIDALMQYFDTYEPFMKQSNQNNISDAMKILLTIKGESMIGYKTIGDPTTYVELSGRLVPVADWPAFVSLGGSTDSVVELTAEQFAKFVKVDTVLFKTK